MTVAVAVFANGHVDLAHLELPERAPGEVDVAISTAAICGSDLHTVLGHRAAPDRVALGHEAVGSVFDVDPGRTDLRGQLLRPGDRVVFGLFAACGHCDRCVAGLAMKCRTLVKYGHESVTTYPYATGGLANQTRLLPGTPVLRIGAEVPDQRVVSAGCAVATAAAIVDAAGQVGSGDRVLLYGAGALGTYATAMLLGKGCEVHVVEPSARRRELVDRIGATSCRPKELVTDQPFRVVIEASGNPRAFTEGLGLVDVGGRFVAAGSVSLGNTRVGFDPAVLVTRRITLVGVHNYTTDDFANGVDWLHTDGANVDLSGLTSKPLPLNDIREAFEQMRSGRHPRVLVRP